MSTIDILDTDEYPVWVLHRFTSTHALEMKNKKK